MAFACALSIVATGMATGCSSKVEVSGGGGGGSSNGGGNAGAGGGSAGGTAGGSAGGTAGGGGTGNGDAGTSNGTITLIIRDFKFYSASDPTTNANFENVPSTPSPWPDPDIVTTTLGPDHKPVYKNTTGTTLTTHGAASFNQWYNDVAGTNIHVDYPLVLTQAADGSWGYDSNVSGVDYTAGNDSTKGFFPIDDGSPYATAFGNQGIDHNFSFTAESHTTFTYNGGETFHYRGDDDVFVYINNQLVINLGGIHDPETGDVALDSLGLTKGQSYPLDFFFAERHQGGSNMLFTTTLLLAQAPII
ncbi:MAG TPA: fibro-slime domain-containing protein [Polyangia bacterium]|nr:fibro-slime domain-containing protein [Polyangia bacterium]